MTAIQCQILNNFICLQTSIFEKKIWQNRLLLTLCHLNNTTTAIFNIIYIFKFWYFINFIFKICIWVTNSWLVFLAVAGVLLYVDSCAFLRCKFNSPSLSIRMTWDYSFPAQDSEYRWARVREYLISNGSNSWSMFCISLISSGSATFCLLTSGVCCWKKGRTGSGCL